MVESDAYHGNSKKSPFNFQNFKISSFTAAVNGLELAPRNLTFNFNQTNPQSQRAYFQLFKQLQGYRFDYINQITRKSFNSNNFILCYDLSPTGYSSDCASILEGGSIRLEAKFSEALTTPITALVYLQFDADLVIDRDRNVYSQLL